eukprot:GHVH01008947.1.p1 GENE.GHVH01008947.1~~GHVH01008947.1.p1  ORF type:complete len:415 (+),score=51.45 GHVH01008947.1:89-1333(+)
MKNKTADDPAKWNQIIGDSQRKAAPWEIMTSPSEIVKQKLLMQKGDSVISTPKAELGETLLTDHSKAVDNPFGKRANWTNKPKERGNEPTGVDSFKPVDESDMTPAQRYVHALKRNRSLSKTAQLPARSPASSVVRQVPSTTTTDRKITGPEIQSVSKSSIGDPIGFGIKTNSGEQKTAITEKATKIQEGTNITEKDTKIQEGTNITEKNTKIQEGTNITEKDTKIQEGTNITEKDSKIQEGTNITEKDTKIQEGTNITEKQSWPVYDGIPVMVDSDDVEDFDARTEKTELVTQESNKISSKRFPSSNVTKQPSTTTDTMPNKISSSQRLPSTNVTKQPSTTTDTMPNKISSSQRLPSSNVTKEPDMKNEETVVMNSKTVAAEAKQRYAVYDGYPIMCDSDDIEDCCHQTEGSR